MSFSGNTCACVCARAHTHTHTCNPAHRVSRPRGTGSVGDSVGEGASVNACRFHLIYSHLIYASTHLFMRGRGQSESEEGIAKVGTALAKVGTALACGHCPWQSGHWVCQESQHCTACLHSTACLHCVSRESQHFPPHKTDLF